MSVEFTIVPLQPQEQEIQFHRSLSDDEMATLRGTLHSGWIKRLLPEDERYQSPIVSRRKAWWHAKDIAAHNEILAVVTAFAEQLPDETLEHLPERSYFGGGEPLSRRL